MASEVDNFSRYLPRAAAQWHRTSGRLHREIEGTLCFADISGFTALSEKLAERGRIGAEELTDALNPVFGEMLRVAYDRGGSLLKFGGDALLLMFTGDNHSAQACSAAVEMQSALRATRSRRTSAGRLNLKMSVGLHRGTINLFRVGGSHHEFIISGPAASVTTEMEETASAGQILVSPATERALPEGSPLRPQGGGRLLGWRKARVEPTGPVPGLPVAHEILAASVPLALRTHLAEGRIESEHRVATVGFVGYSGVDSLMAEHGPGAVAAALDELVRVVQESADAEGVTFLASDIAADGGKIILVAGVPGVREDDEGRLLRAARRIVERAGILTVKIGVNRGHVFVGAIGTEFRATYTVMGDTVNLAARLMAAASPGTVYADASVLDRSRTVFETVPLEPFRVKGKQHPVQAYSVGVGVGRRRAEGRRELPFVGRAAELARLGAAVDLVREGTGSVLTVVGERGAGKSRLVEEVVAPLEEIGRLEIRAESFDFDTPYWPLRDPLRRLLGIEPAEPEVMGRRLREAVGRLAPDRMAFLPLIADVTMIEVAGTVEVDRLVPRFRQDRTADVVIELIAAAHSGPLIIGVEDGHHVDAASTHVLERIAAATVDQPWLVVTTRREDAGGFEPGHDVIHLGPLPDDDSRALVIAATEAAPLRPNDVKAIVERAGGVPMFLEEIVVAVRRSGGVDDLPDSLEAVVGAEVDALAALPRLHLRFASVLGRSFSVAIWDRLLEAEGLHLDGAARRELDVFLEPAEEGRLRFRHVVTRDVAYEGLSFRRRRELHLRAGGVVEEVAGEQPEELAGLLALHFSRGQDHQRAWVYARLAADHARDTFTNDAAVTHYRSAITAARHLDDVGDGDLATVWTSLGDVCERAGRFEESLDAYRRATRLMLDDPYARVDLLAKRALVRRMANSYSAALRETAEGLKLVAHDLSVSGARARAKLTVERAAIRRWQQQPGEALRLAEVAETDARSGNDLASLALALDIIDWARRMMGNTDLEVHYAEALAIFEELGDMSGVALVWNNLGAEAYWEGRWDDAVEAYAMSREAEVKNGNDVQAAIPAANTAELLVSQGRLDEAEPLLRLAVRVLTASGHPAVGFVKSELARLLIDRGDHDAAGRLLEEVREWGEANAEPVSVLNATILSADSMLRQGLAREALTILDEVEANAGDMAEVFGPVLARLRGRGLGDLDRFGEALENIEIGMTEARQQGLLYDQALLLEARCDIVAAQGGVPDSADREEADRLLGKLGVRRQSVVQPQLA